MEIVFHTPDISNCVGGKEVKSWQREFHFHINLPSCLLYQQEIEETFEEYYACFAVQMPVMTTNF